MEEEIYTLETAQQMFEKVCRFISRCTPTIQAVFLQEILSVTPILAWDVETKRLLSVDSISINEESIQLNLEQEHK